MNKTKVVDLGTVRDLLAEWERVRSHILAGGIAGFQVAFCGENTNETIFVGGTYKDNPTAALRVALKMSAARVLTEDPPPLLKNKH